MPHWRRRSACRWWLRHGRSLQRSWPPDASIWRWTWICPCRTASCASAWARIPWWWWRLGAGCTQRPIALRCQHYFAACEVVAAGTLWLTMPHSYAQVVARTLALDIQPLPLDLPPLALYLYWHRHLDEDPANRWLCELVLAQWWHHVDGAG